ncbi:MAG TPA: zinc-binding dehydrogenase [Candidatus Dormibacteraeota bacterium]
MRAVVAVRQGGPEVLELQEVPEPQAAEGQVLIRVASAGVNFADTLSTRGLYAASPPPPFVPGLEVAGTLVDGGGPVMAILASGGYAEVAAADPRLMIPAEGLDLEQAGGYLLVTLTAYYALAEAVRIRPGESVLVTAGAGGLGSTAIQVARALGAGRITAVASSEEKRRYAREQGADDAIGYEADFPRSEVVFETVGGDVFKKCLEAVPPLGRMALIGASGGAPPEVPAFDALRRRNVGIFCFSFGMLRRADAGLVAATAPRAVELLRSGRVRPPVGLSLPLKEAADAHRRLVSRQTVGKILLTP